MFRFAVAMILCWPLPLIAADLVPREEASPLAAWSFDEGRGTTAGDSSGRHPGMISGAQWCKGRKGSALRFDGVDDFVDCGAALNLTKEFTIEAWVRPQNPIRHNMTIVAKGYRYAGNYNLRMGTPWDHSKVMLEARARRTHEIPIPYEKWSHIVGVCDGQRVGVFINGKLASERPTVSGLKPNETSVTIGKCIGAPGGEHFLGIIDEVKIYDRVLPQYRLSGTTGSTINRAVRTVTSRGEWGEYEGFPGLCRLKNGELLVVFFAARDHMDWPHPALPRRGRICVMRSTDEGKSWSTPLTLIDGRDGERDPSIAQLKNGTVICSYYGTTWYEHGRVCEVRTLRSFDDGRTWETKPTIVPAPWYTEKQQQEVIAKAGPPAVSASYEHPIREKFKAINATTREVRELSDGTLILPIYGQFGDEPYRSALARSRDNGETWGDISMISEEHHHCEPDIAELPDGRLLCVLRPCMCQVMSTDKGRTWSAPIGALPRGEAPSLLLTSQGVLLCGHRERPGTCTGVLISTDFGTSWSLPRMIDVAGGAYTSMVELSGGRILCLHYQEALGGNIRQAIFEVDPEARQIRLVLPDK